MLSIRKSSNGQYIQWHVGFPMPVHPSDVEDIQADGDELDIIYDNSPILLNGRTGNLVQSFYGDIARTLYANIPWHKYK